MVFSRSWWPFSSPLQLCSSDRSRLGWVTMAWVAYPRVEFVYPFVESKLHISPCKVFVRWKRAGFYRYFPINGPYCFGFLLRRWCWTMACYLLPTWFPFHGWHVVVCSGRTCMITWTCLKPCFDISQSYTYTWIYIYCITIRTLPTHTLWWASKNSKGLFKARVFNFPSIAFFAPLEFLPNHHFWQVKGTKNAQF